MRIEILDSEGNVERVIVADEAFAEAKFPGRWRVAAEQPEPVPQPRTITQRAFMRRMTSTERRNILTAARTDVAVEDAYAMLRAGLTVDLSDSLTVEFVHDIETSGLIAEGRAAQILTAAVEDQERP